MKYVPYIVLALFITLSGVTYLNSEFDASQTSFISAEANIFDSVLSWFGVVDLNKSSAVGCTGVRPTDHILSYDDLARRNLGRPYSQLNGFEQTGIRNSFAYESQQTQYEAARNAYFQCIAGQSSKGGGGCFPPRGQDFYIVNPNDPSTVTRNTNTNAQGVSWEQARNTYFQCLANQQRANQNTTTTTVQPIQAVTISGKVTNLAGQGVANVDVFDNNRVAVTVAGNTIPDPGNAVLAASSPVEFSEALTPGDWTICVSGANFGPTGMAMYMGEVGGGNIPFTATSPNTGFFRLSPEDFQGLPVDANGIYNGVGYLTRGEASSDYLFFTVDTNGGDTGVHPARCSTTVPTGSRTEYQNRSGQGTLRIGRTNANGEVVFDQQFITFLQNTFPGNHQEYFANGAVKETPKVQVSNGNRTVALVPGSSVPGGLTARYEYQDSGEMVTDTKEITVNNGLMDLSTQINLSGSDESGETADRVCRLIWDDPRNEDGMGVRRIGQPSNVSIVLSGFSANSTVIIKNTNLNNNETRSAPVTVNAQGGFDVNDQTPIRKDEYKVGTYKTEIVDSSHNVLAECDNGFVIKAPIVTKKPKIKSFSPLAGTFSDTIILKGSNFSLDENKVWLDENYSDPRESDNGNIIEFNVENFPNLFFAENSFAFRIGVENNSGAISKPASNWLTIYQEGEENPLTIESVSPFSLKAGRIASLSVVGKNLSAIKEVNVSSGDVTLVNNSLRITNLGRQRNRVRFKLNVDPNAEPGFYNVVLSDGAEVERTIGFKIEILPVRVSQESVLNRFLSWFGVKVQLEKGFAEEP